MRDIVLALVSSGHEEEDASKRAGISLRTLQRWKQNDPLFAGELANARGYRTDAERTEVPGFEEFRKECLGHETYPNQKEWLEALEASDRVLILVPPAMGKSFTWSVDYPVWRIVSDRNSRGIIVSKTQVMARKWLYAIKTRLSDRTWYQRNGYRNLIEEWGPFRPTKDEKHLSWAVDKIYVSGVDSGEKDPTVEVLGVGNQIYGARADYIVLDDIATLDNQMSPVEREKLLAWLSQEVITRLSSEGKLIICGTRTHEQDIYGSFLHGDEPWMAGYKAVVQQAIPDEDAGQVLCPEMWSLEDLLKRRDEVSPRTWSLVYQQQATGMDDAPFSVESLERAKDESFVVGQRGEHLEVVIGVDPALSGTAALVVLGLDRASGVRHVIDVQTESPRNPGPLKDWIVGNAGRYRAREVRIEQSAMQGLLSRDEELRARLASVGAHLAEEHTGKNKFDPEWGVASVAAQFDANWYRIPWGNENGRIRAFLEELAAWRPGVRMKQDQVMALWFAELSARFYESMGNSTFKRDPRVPEWVRKRLGVPPWVAGRRERARRRRVA